MVHTVIDQGSVGNRLGQRAHRHADRLRRIQPAQAVVHRLHLQAGGTRKLEHLAETQLDGERAVDGVDRADEGGPQRLVRRPALGIAQMERDVRALRRGSRLVERVSVHQRIRKRERLDRRPG